MEFRDGNASEALRHANQALAVRALGDRRYVAHALSNIATYLTALRRFDEALATARDALTYACDAQYSGGLVWSLQHLAAIGALRPSADTLVIENRRRAARILGYVDARVVALEASRQYTEQQEYDAMIPALHDALGDDELATFMTEGASWSEDQAVAEAMLI